VSSCDHFSCTSKNGVKTCDRCGAEVTTRLQDEASYYGEALEGLNQTRLNQMERRSANHKACARDIQNEKAFGDGSWSSGRVIPHLDPRDPDRRVTNERQMREVYEKNGICMDTAEVIDQEKFNKRQGEVRRKNRKPGWNKKQPGATLQKSKGK